jgi:hypothetical protein
MYGFEFYSEWRPSSFSEMLAILMLTQDVAEQYAALRRIHKVLERTPDRRPESALLAACCSSVAISGSIFRLHRCFSSMLSDARLL